MFNFTGAYELPIGKNTNRVLGKLLKGWTLNGILRYDSGRPLVITMNNDLAGLLFNGVKRPNRTEGTPAVVDLSNFDPGQDQLLQQGRLDRSRSAAVRQRPSVRWFGPRI